MRALVTDLNSTEKRGAWINLAFSTSDSFISHNSSGVIVCQSLVLTLYILQTTDGIYKTYIVSPH